MFKLRQSHIDQFKAGILVATCQTMGSSLGLVGPVSAYCAWVSVCMCVLAVTA